MPTNINVLDVMFYLIIVFYLLKKLPFNKSTLYSLLLTELPCNFILHAFLSHATIPMTGPPHSIGPTLLLNRLLTHLGANCLHHTLVLLSLRLLTNLTSISLPLPQFACSSLR